MYLDESKVVHRLGSLSHSGDSCFTDVVKEYGPFRLRQIVHRRPDGRILASIVLGIFLKPEQQDVPSDLLEGTAQEIPLGTIPVNESDFAHFLAIMKRWVHQQDYMIVSSKEHWAQQEDQEMAKRALADIERRWVRRQNVVKPAVEK
jgi:hypothetical protein